MNRSIIEAIEKEYMKAEVPAFNVGDVVKVAVLDVDQKRGRISLTMKGVK